MDLFKAYKIKNIIPSKTLCTSSLIVYSQRYDTLLPTSYFPILTLVIVNICGKDVINVFLFSISQGGKETFMNLAIFL